jgi:hypothetical protein
LFDKASGDVTIGVVIGQEAHMRRLGYGALFAVVLLLSSQEPTRRAHATAQPVPIAGTLWRLWGTDNIRSWGKTDIDPLEAMLWVLGGGTWELWQPGVEMVYFGTGAWSGDGKHAWFQFDTTDYAAFLGELFTKSLNEPGASVVVVIYKAQVKARFHRGDVPRIKFVLSWWGTKQDKNSLLYDSDPHKINRKIKAWGELWAYLE